MDATPRGRARQPARRHRAVARRRGRSGAVGQVRGRADALLVAARVLDRGTQVRARLARAPRRAGIGRRARACALRRRGARGQPERLRRGGADARAVPRRCGAGSAIPVDIAATLSTLSLVRLHDGRRASAREGERGGAGHLPRARRSHRRGDRAASSRRDLHARRRRRAGAQAISSSASPSRATSSTASSRASASACWARSRSRPATLPGLAHASRARRKSARAPQDKRDEATSLWWVGKADLAARDYWTARTRLDAALRALEAFEMNAEVLGLPGGSCRACTVAGPRRRSRAPIRGGGLPEREAQPDPPAAQRAAMARSLGGDASGTR